jgi:hypothetical protein
MLIEARRPVLASSVLWFGAVADAGASLIPVRLRFRSGSVATRLILGGGSVPFRSPSGSVPVAARFRCAFLLEIGGNLADSGYSAGKSFFGGSMYLTQIRASSGSVCLVEIQFLMATTRKVKSRVATWFSEFRSICVKYLLPFFG